MGKGANGRSLPVVSRRKGPGCEKCAFNNVFGFLVLATSWCALSIIVMTQRHKPNVIICRGENDLPLGSPSDTTHKTTTTATRTTQADGRIVVAGLARDPDQIRPTTWNLLVELSCSHGVFVHIIVQNVSAPGNSSAFCTPFYIEQQDELIHPAERPETDAQKERLRNRVRRLALIRDAQRNRIKSLFFSSKSSSVVSKQQLYGSRVVILDLDLWAFPTASAIVNRTQNMHDMDVICGAGNYIDAPRKKLLYYDNFALVFWPDTHAYQVDKRFIPRLYLGEDGRLIPHETKLVNITKKGVTRRRWISGFDQYSIFEVIIEKALEDPRGLMPVRSCFGGLAIYRASVWLQPTCRYSLSEEDEEKEKNRRHQRSIFRYADSAEGVPCEHVVFHDCLHRRLFEKPPPPSKTMEEVQQAPQPPRPHIGIDPLLMAHWRKNEHIRGAEIDLNAEERASNFDPEREIRRIAHKKAQQNFNAKVRISTRKKLLANATQESNTTQEEEEEEEAK